MSIAFSFLVRGDGSTSEEEVSLFACDMTARFERADSTEAVNFIHVVSSGLS